MVTLPAFAAIESMVNEGVTATLSNAMLQLTVDGVAWACSYEASRPDGSPFADLATTLVHSVSVWMADGEDALKEGATVILTTTKWPSGKACRITSEVDIDATGWAHFDVMPS